MERQQRQYHQVRGRQRAALSSRLPSFGDFGVERAGVDHTMRKRLDVERQPGRRISVLLDGMEMTLALAELGGKRVKRQSFPRSPIG
jgi:hypothetical protein